MPVTKDTKLILAASYGTAVGALIFNTQPAIVGALATAFQFTETELGSIITIVLIAVFCLVLSSFHWVHRAQSRSVVLVGATVACFGALGLAFADSFSSVAFSLGLIGSGAAGVYVVSLASLARSADPARAFGIAITTQVAVACFVVYLVPIYIVPSYGIIGVAVLLFLLLALAFSIAPYFSLSPSSVEMSKKPRSKQADRSAGWVMLGLGAMTIYFVGLNGTWVFLERIGVMMLLSSNVIGPALAGSLLFGAIGSVLASVLGKRINVGVALWFSGAGFLIFVYLMLEIPGAVAFVVALVVFNIAWNFSLPYQMDLISKADASGRYIVLVPAAQTIGGAIGPAIAGPLLVSSGVVGVYMQLVICIALAFLFYVILANSLKGKSTVDVISQ